jgi:hypothetical protein
MVVITMWIRIYLLNLSQLIFNFLVILFLIKIEIVFILFNTMEIIFYFIYL